MKEPMKNRRVQMTCQVERMRKLYSQIGEPLPVDVMLDLHRHLGAALEIDENQREKPKNKKTRLQA